MAELDPTAASFLVFVAAMILAFVLERLFEIYVKPFVPDRFKRFIPLSASIVGLLFAFGFSVDLMTPILEPLSIMPAWTWLGTAVTGLVIGGGSNLVHDLWTAVVGFLDRG